MEEVKELTEQFKPELVIIESGGDNLAANFSRELADFIIYVVDVAGKTNRSQGNITFFMLNSTELKFQLLMKTKISTIEEVSRFRPKSLRCCIYHAHKCSNANNCWHFNIYKQDKFRSQLS